MPARNRSIEQIHERSKVSLETREGQACVILTSNFSLGWMETRVEQIIKGGLLQG